MSKKLFAGLVLSLSMLSTAYADKAAPMETPAKDVAPKAAELDLNTSTEAELAGLQGVGAATAKQIVAARPFTKAEDLVSKKLLTQAAFDKIKANVVVKVADAAPPAAPPAKDAKLAPKK